MGDLGVCDERSSKELSTDKVAEPNIRNTVEAVTTEMKKLGFSFEDDSLSS